MSKEVFESLRTLSLATNDDVEEHIRRALDRYLAEEGHSMAVLGFADRARELHRLALDKLGDV